jgi:hypothetical protein
MDFQKLRNENISRFLTDRIPGVTPIHQLNWISSGTIMGNMKSSQGSL